MGEIAGWCIWLALGLLLVVIGFTGALGKVVAVAFSPGILEWQVAGSSGSAGGGSSSAG